MPVPTLELLSRPPRHTLLRDTAAPVSFPAPTAACHAGWQETSPHLWGIILAGGDGQRLQPLTQAYWGSARPQQSCTFFGNRSLLRQTLGRAEQLIPAARLLTIVTKCQLVHAREELCDRAPETVIIQPCNRDTGAGILLPLLHHGRQLLPGHPGAECPLPGRPPVHGMHWSDWGSPAWVLQDLVRYHLGEPSRVDGPHRGADRWS